MKQPKNILMAALAYFGPLVIVSYLIAKDDPFVKFHIKQSLAVILVSIIISIGSMFMFFPFRALFGLFHFVLGIFVIIGILNALQGKEKELPILGPLADSFDF